MPLFDLALFGVPALLCLVYAFWRPSSAMASARSARFAEQFRLQVAPRDSSRLEYALDRRRRGRGIFMAAGFVAMGAVWSFTPSWASEETLGTSFVLVLLFGGAWLGCLLSELTPRLRAASGTRSARARALGVADFLHPFTRAYLALLACVGVVLTAFPSTRLAYMDHVTAATGLIPLVTWLGCEAFGRILVALPQPAVDAGDLYLADALRSDALSVTYVLGLWLASVTTFYSTDADENSALAWLLTVAALGAAAAFMRAPERSILRFRERLWPRVPRDAVISTQTGGPVA